MATALRRAVITLHGEPKNIAAEHLAVPRRRFLAAIAVAANNENRGGNFGGSRGGFGGNNGSTNNESRSGNFGGSRGNSGSSTPHYSTPHSSGGGNGGGVRWRPLQGGGHGGRH